MANNRVNAEHGREEIREGRASDIRVERMIPIKSPEFDSRASLETPCLEYAMREMQKGNNETPSATNTNQHRHKQPVARRPDNMNA